MDNKLSDNKFGNIKKNKKYHKYIVYFYKKLSCMMNHVDFLFKNKFIIQEFYIEKMYLLDEIKHKILNLESLIEKKKIIKVFIENFLKEINNLFEVICVKIGCNSIKNIINIFLFQNNNEKYLSINNFLEEQNIDYQFLFNLYKVYFVPLSSKKINENDIEKMTNKYNIVNNIPKIVKLIDYSKVNPLIERLNGASIFLKIHNKLILINGYFNNDSLNIFKNVSEFKLKFSLIEEQLEYMDISLDFKEKYIEQLSLRDFLTNEPKEVAQLIKNDYDELLSYKSKSLSLLIKDFIKSNVEKQRKIILLHLLYDQESQFTAHIIFDLITDKSFLSESQNLSELIYNSLHWKIQQIFKISNEHFENQKNKIENMSISDIPYESRILNLKVSDNIRAKANEKLKEINGSKDSSIKAQQWLDGFLKIPFDTYRKEPIIDFFKKFQLKVEKFIDMFTIKISEYNFDKLNYKNQNIYNIIIQIIDEYHSNIYKSEHSCDLFINYIENIKLNIDFLLGPNKSNIRTSSISSLSDCDMGENKNNLSNFGSYFNGELSFGKSFIDDNKNLLKSNNDLYNLEEIKIQTIDNDLFLLDNKDTSTIIEDIIKNDIIPCEAAVNDCMNQLNYFKKVKSELYDNNIINKNNIGTMVKKLNELECMLNINLIKNEEHNDNNNNEYEFNNDSYNIGFTKFIIKNIDEFDLFINNWNDFKLKKQNYMKQVDQILDKCTYGQTCAKNQMKRIIGQWMNGNSKGQCFGLQGPPGVGKTTLCKNGLAKCLFDENGESRPFAFLPLGGATNGSILEGHHYTYLGSTWGKIVDILMETKCMNPIIYIDELDKISKTEHGKEIISILTHITDQSQNKEFYDRYFSSIPIDLSQVLFIFSYNDKDGIDRILRDRIQEIEIKPLSLKEKIVISQNYIIPEILNNVGFSISEVLINDTLLTKIINEYTYEAGVRKLNELLYDIIRDINLKKIITHKKIEYPILINEENTNDILSIKPQITIKTVHNAPKVGLVCGLYATCAGLGGLTIIQVMKVNSDKKFSLEKLTGNQGDVMKESMSCSMTLAWNIIPDYIKKEINEAKESWGLHIHCPEGGTPKDGPSAGLAITMGIVSRLVNIPIRNDLALTGEVDLLGNAHAIGGLYSKLQGALSAGVKTVLIPFDNKKDMDIIFKKEKEENKNMIKLSKSKLNFNNLLIENSKIDSNKILFRNEMEIIYVNNIFDVLKHGLIKNDLLFNELF